jgi:hypothetical protein
VKTRLKDVEDEVERLRAEREAGTAGRREGGGDTVLEGYVGQYNIDVLNRCELTRLSKLEL